MKTRIRVLSNGAQEIIRLLSPSDLAAASKDDPLFYEKSIVWLVDISKLRFVRAKTIRTALGRRGPIYLGGDARVVGYSKLTPDARRDEKSRGYVRRVFYLTADDEAGPDQQIPASAVDPRTVFAGEPGQAATDSIANARG